MPSLSRSERVRLCEAALAAGPDAPTLCGDWTVKDLIVHLLIRDGDPLGAPGILVKPLSFLTERAGRRLEAESLEDLVARVRRPPPWSPASLPPVDRALNTLEFFVHHEDIRRAADRWRPRTLTPGEQRQLWKAIGYAGRGLVRSVDVPVVIGWGERTATLRRGSDPVRITGDPGELVLFLFGRGRVRDLEFAGPPEAVAAVRAADFGI